MSKIDLNSLTEKERSELMADLANKQKEAKQKRKADIKSFKELSAEFVARNVNGLVEKRTDLEKLIESLFDDYQDILTLKESIYGLKSKKQDSHTSTLEDGSASITIGFNVTIGFDGTESAGIDKIKEYMSTLSSEDEKVKTLNKMVNTFLKVNKKTGQLNPSKIIELAAMRDEVNNEMFDEGIEIIFNAQIRQRNSMYVSGWKYIERPNKPPQKVEFRFTI